MLATTGSCVVLPVVEVVIGGNGPYRFAIGTGAALGGSGSQAGGDQGVRARAYLPGVTARAAHRISGA